MMKKVIYADHAATTPLSPAAYEAMLPWLLDNYGNPSTLYSLAREPRKAIERARETIADVIGAFPDEIYFTSGGTEADNWALNGIAFSQPTKKSRIVTSNVEHHAILHTCSFLERMGIDVCYLPVDEVGLVSLDVLRKALSIPTTLVSIMLANNEIGTLQPVQKLASLAHEHGSLFHTDAVQAVGHIPVNVQELEVDLLSSSAHKFNGPKGSGFLFIKRGTKIEPLLHGGSQENGYRAGTENVAGIVGMAAALMEHRQKMLEEMNYLTLLADTLISELRAAGLDFKVNGAAKRIPGSLSISFKHGDGEMLLHRLDLLGTQIATGSACDSNDAVVSHVIEAIGASDEYTHGTVRITLGMDNTTEQVQMIARQINSILGN